MTDSDAPIDPVMPDPTYDSVHLEFVRDRAIELGRRFLAVFLSSFAATTIATGFSWSKQALIAAAIAAANEAYQTIASTFVQGGPVRAMRARLGSGLRSPDALGWGNPGKPGSTQGKQFFAAHIITRTSKTGIRLTAHRSAIALFLGFVDECAAHGYVVRQRDTGAYNHRYMRVLGKILTKLSAHSWGCAMDMNWSTNPQSSKLVTDLPQWVRDLGEKKYGFAWGGRFSVHDPMHWQVNESPGDAEARAKRLGLAVPAR